MTAPLIVDLSETGKLALTGPDATGALSGQCTNDVEGLADGAGLYAAVLSNKGKMLGDLRVLRIGDPAADGELLLLTERAALQAVFDVLRRALVGWRAELHKRTLQQGLLAVLGPGAAAVAGAGAAGLPEEEHAHVAAELGGAPVRLVRTAFGVEVLCAAEDVEPVRAALLTAGGEPGTEADLERLRIEAGRPRYGVDLDDSVIPQEAGLNERAVSFTKGCYVGQETVARLFYKGKPNRHLRGLRLEAPVPAGAPLVLDGREVGRLTSVTESPRLGPIGLALLRREAEPGAELDLAGTRAQVVELPFADVPAPAA